MRPGPIQTSFSVRRAVQNMEKSQMATVQSVDEAAPPVQLGDEAAPKAGGTVFLMLCSSLKREVVANQQMATTILNSKKIPFETLDGADPTNKNRRNELFDISGLPRGQYPQFFLVHQDGATSFWGDWDSFVSSNDSGTLVQEIGDVCAAPKEQFVPQADESHERTSVERGFANETVAPRGPLQKDFTRNHGYTITATASVPLASEGRLETQQHVDSRPALRLGNANVRASFERSFGNGTTSKVPQEPVVKEFASSSGYLATKPKIPFVGNKRTVDTQPTADSHRASLLAGKNERTSFERSFVNENTTLKEPPVLDFARSRGYLGAGRKIPLVSKGAVEIQPSVDSGPASLADKFNGRPTFERSVDNETTAPLRPPVRDFARSSGYVAATPKIPLVRERPVQTQQPVEPIRGSLANKSYESTSLERSFGNETKARKEPLVRDVARSRGYLAATPKIPLLGERAVPTKPSVDAHRVETLQRPSDVAPEDHITNAMSRRRGRMGSLVNNLCNEAAAPKKPLVSEHGFEASPTRREPSIKEEQAEPVSPEALRELRVKNLHLEPGLTRKDPTVEHAGVDNAPTKRDPLAEALLRRGRRMGALVRHRNVAAMSKKPSIVERGTEVSVPERPPAAETPLEPAVEQNEPPVEERGTEAAAPPKDPATEAMLRRRRRMRAAYLARMSRPSH